MMTPLCLLQEDQSSLSYTFIATFFDYDKRNCVESYKFTLGSVVFNQTGSF